MPAVTTIVAVAGVAAALGGTVVQQKQAASAKKQAKKQAEEAQAAATAKKPGTATESDVALQDSDKDRKRGKGSLAQRTKAAELAGPAASSVGGL